jgi:hypothetical protein
MLQSTNNFRRFKRIVKAESWSGVRQTRVTKNIFECKPELDEKWLREVEGADNDLRNWKWRYGGKVTEKDECLS